MDQRELLRRQEEEFQARYRSDPNLARYPVKPQPSEEAMRMLAQVGRFRHQRRHSDVSLAAAEPDHLTLRHSGGKKTVHLLLPCSRALGLTSVFSPSQVSVRIGLRDWLVLEASGHSLWTEQPIT